MKFWKRPPSLRVSLTLWYVGAMVIVLGAYVAGVLTFVSRSVSSALDERLRSDFQWAAEMADHKPDGSLTWFEGDRNTEERPWLQVWNNAGQLIFRTSVAERNPIPESEWLASHAADQRIVTVPATDTTIRVLSGPARVDSKPVVIQVARSEAAMKQQLKQLVLILVLGLPFGVAAAGLGGYSLARRALAPVDRMAERARTITAERLHDRLPVDNPNDELGRLASVFNETLGRLEGSFDQMRHFTADVSHELRTPLTAIRSVGEVGLRDHRSEDAYRGIIGSMLEEVDRLASLIDRLLAWSRAESGQAKLAPEVIDLHPLAEDIVSYLGVLAEEKGQSLTIEGAGAAIGLGDRLVLRQSLINLVDNAIKYTPAGGRIRIMLSESDASAMIDVSDTGPGIAPELRTRIFDRYYRAGRSRSGELGGVGLGLSISKWAIEANGGQLTLEATAGPGSTFRITLPRPGAPRQQETRRRSVA